ncbi:MAG: hypothetical protein JSR75_15155 [Proteobacteria bacterium]|nr:hypothetical protein [Pseudomonadota bacterium]
MKRRERPHLGTDARRAQEFRAELLARARAWMRGWSVHDAPGDFGAALFDVAARFSAQVAERLDRADEKLSLGLLDWLAVRGQAAKPARMPVVFKLADTARDPVLAPRAVQLQANVTGGSVVFETESDVNLVPGTLAQLVAVDAAADAWFVPPPGLTSLDPLDPLPNRWMLKNFADQDATKLQLDPALGLAEGTLLEIAGHQYRVAKVDGDLVEIEPGVQAAGGLALPMEATRVASFDPFGGAAHNQQRHIVYLGDKDLFNLEEAAVLEILGTHGKLSGATWEFFGKGANGEDAAWRELEFSKDPAKVAGALRLEKPTGSVEPTDVGSVKGVRWIRARQTSVADENDVLETDALSVVLNPGAGALPCPSSGIAPPGAEGAAQGFANTLPLSFNSPFYPLGREPKQFDSFYLGSADAFSKHRADVSICFELSDLTANSFSVMREGLFAYHLLASLGGDGALHLIEVDGTTGALKRFLNHEPLQPNANGVAVKLDSSPVYRLPVWAVEDDGLVPAPSANVPPPTPFGNPFGGILGLGFFGTGLFGILGPQTNNPFYVAAGAGTTVWVYKEYPSYTPFSRWLSFGNVPGTGDHLDGLVYLRDGGDSSSSRLFALCGGALFSHSALAGNPSQVSRTWTPITISGGPGDPLFKLDAIEPIWSMDADGRWHGTVADGMVGVFRKEVSEFRKDDVLRVYLVRSDGTCTAVDDAQPAQPGTRPAATHVADSIYVFWQLKKPAVNPEPPAQLHAKRLLAANLATVVAAIPDPAAGGGPLKFEGGLFEIVPLNVPVTVAALPADVPVTLLATGTRENTSTVVTWALFSNKVSEYFPTPAPTGIGPLGGAPSALPGFIIVPGTQSDAWSVQWDPSRRRSFSGTLQSGVVVPAEQTPALVRHDWIALPATGSPLEHAEVGVLDDTLGDERFHSLDDEFGIGAADAELVVYRAGSNPAGLAATRFDTDRLDLHASDVDTVADDWLLLKIDNTFRFCQVHTVDVNTPPKRVTFTHSPNPNIPATATVVYWRAELIAGRVAPFMELNPSGSGDWDASLLDQTPIRFANRVPATQRAKAFSKTSTNRPLRVVLDAAWDATTPSGNGNTTFSFDASFSGWSRQLSEGASNPKLLWEYWDGRTWETLPLQADATENLKLSGRLEFAVPAGLAPTDVGGKTDHWIRARLIEGDYGREIVTVETRPNPSVPNGTIQQVVRDTSNFHPPLVVNMRIRYSFVDGALPTWLLTEDSGSLRDQSDANRTQGALVEAFVPLSVLMKRLAPALGIETTSTAGTAPLSAPCGCGPAAPSGTEPPAAATTQVAPSTVDSHSVLLGFDAGLKGEPVNVQLLVDERPNDGFAPLAVEALTRDRFEALTVKDTTRALGESGLLSMSFPVQPSPHDLFGRTLSWVRLRPSRTDANATWQPVVRGAYLNAVWASATETLTREPLGSSDGRPHLTVRVARPPLLQNTLELRVREPLDDEERKAMLDAETTADEDRRRVKYGLADLPGNWVLWKQVADPADCGPHERVYALDEALGEIRFGDGLHGMIPPIGRDAIVAFAYQRTEPPTDGSDVAPANGVPARSKLNLVTPVESVEAAAAADHAAGGAPPENVARVQRFGNARLRHRGRALTLADFEDLALASSPDIVQARAFARAGAVRVVIVMRGAKPLPDAAQRRALRRKLQAAASPLIAEHGRLVVEGAQLRRLRLKLKLVVADLDNTGAVANTVKHALAGFFDSASGGVDGTGWPLGAAPGDDDIAFALGETPALEGIEHIERLQVGDDGQVHPWSAAVRADELVLLDDDPVRLDFATLEVAT